MIIHVIEYYGAFKANLYVQTWEDFQTYFLEKYVMKQCKQYDPN